MSRRLLLWSMIPQLTVLAIFTPLAMLTGSPTFSFVSIGLSVGIGIGSIIGSQTRVLILKNVYGEQWRTDLALGSFYRQKREEAPLN